MKGRTPTADEKRFMSQVGGLGCIVCRLFLYVYSPCSIHHIDGRVKPGAHFKILGLCGPHHQTGGEGVAIHPYKAQWVNKFGTEYELLEKTKELIDETY